MHWGGWWLYGLLDNELCTCYQPRSSPCSLGIEHVTHTHTHHRCKLPEMVPEPVHAQNVHANINF